jgi:5-methylcytosine-specific restriction endonuclease McrA
METAKDEWYEGKPNELTDIKYNPEYIANINAAHGLYFMPGLLPKGKCKECDRLFIIQDEIHNKGIRQFCDQVCEDKYDFRIKENARIAKQRKRKPTASAWAKMRWQVLLRDGFQCQYCGRTPHAHGVALHVDHIKPISKGGINRMKNLITSCLDCNLGKHATDYSGAIKSYFGEKDFRAAYKLESEQKARFEALGRPTTNQSHK